MPNNPIYREDDTDAFNQVWLQIDADIPEDWVVSMASFKVGALPPIDFENPEFPIDVNLSSYQTKMLKDVNNCYLALYDEQGRKVTCEGTLSFKTKAKVV